MRNPGHNESNSLMSGELIDNRLLDKNSTELTQTKQWTLDRNCIKSGRVKNFKPEIISIRQRFNQPHSPDVAVPKVDCQNVDNLNADSPNVDNPNIADLESIRLEAVVGEYSPCSVIQNIDVILNSSEQLDPIQKIQWQETLQQVWLNSNAAQLDMEIIFKIACVAINLGHWGLAKDALYSVLELNAHKIAVYHNLAICEVATGNFDSALKAVDLALLLDKNHYPSRTLKTELASMIQLKNQLPWYYKSNPHSQVLTITPIISFYASAFFEQYRDPAIAKLTQLPAFSSIAQTAEWIAQQVKQTTKATYAVIHQVWGFVGVVSMRIKQSLAYFYFWIGTDFQGLGFGQQATALLFKQAEQLGIKRIYTSAFSDNKRSQNVLKKCGFKNFDYQNSLGLNYYCRHIQKNTEPVLLINELETLFDN